MDAFELGRILHSSAGVVALGAFWTAALAVKGGGLHRRAGGIYLCALIAVMAFSTLMVAGRVARGDTRAAIFLAFLISLLGSSSYLTWFSIRYRRQPERLVNGVYRTLMWWLMAAGTAMFALGVSRRSPMMMFLSLVGFSFGANMWRLARAPIRDGRWRLAQHMNGAALNFIATHDSFIALGIGSVLPEIRTGLPRMLIAVSLTITAVALRLWLGRRYLGARRPSEPPLRVAGAA